MASYEIPLSGAAQAFDVALSGVRYHLSVYYADSSRAGWHIDIATAEQVALARGIRLVPGVNLLRQFDYLGMGGALIVVNDLAPSEAPGYGELGTTSHLIWIEA